MAHIEEGTQMTAPFVQWTQWWGMIKLPHLEWEHQIPHAWQTCANITTGHMHWQFISLF